MAGYISMYKLYILFLISFSVVAADSPQQATPDKIMDNDRLASIIHRLDDKVEGKLGFWRFHIEDRDVTIITDEKADRMRILVPVINVDELQDNELARLMQSNFDAALDARYAIAKDIVWGAFIHPLSSLTDREFLSGLGQTVNLSITFRKTYSSGALVFQGGDSNALQRKELIDQLIERGLAI